MDDTYISQVAVIPANGRWINGRRLIGYAVKLIGSIGKPLNQIIEPIYVEDGLVRKYPVELE